MIAPRQLPVGQTLDGKAHKELINCAGHVGKGSPKSEVGSPKSAEMGSVFEIHRQLKASFAQRFSSKTDVILQLRLMDFD